MTSYATSEQVRHVVQAAGLAPSVHNTQPWRFISRADRVDLRAMPDRRLAVLDPDSRQLHLSCGAALFHARVAARALGLDVHVSLLPEADDVDLLATLAIVAGAPATDDDVRLATAILERHTHRGAFDARPVSSGLLAVLHAAAAAEGARLTQVTNEDQLIQLEVLLSRANAHEESDGAYRDELHRWVRAGEMQPDGIPVGALHQSPGSALTQRRFGPLPDIPAGSAPPAEHPVVVVLVTDDDDRRSWLLAGQALAAVLLRAADHGVQAQPLGQVTDVVAYRLGLRAALGIVGLPQLVLRMGYPTGRSTTPRRTVEDVLVAVAD